MYPQGYARTVLLHTVRGQNEAVEAEGREGEEGKKRGREEVKKEWIKTNIQKTSIAGICD